MIDDILDIFEDAVKEFKQTGKVDKKSFDTKFKQCSFNMSKLVESNNVPENVASDDSIYKDFRDALVDRVLDILSILDPKLKDDLKNAEQDVFDVVHDILTDPPLNLNDRLKNQHGTSIMVTKLKATPIALQFVKAFDSGTTA